MIGKLLCWLLGHRRGRKIDTETLLRRYKGTLTSETQGYSCPRCFAVWVRKIKVKKGPA